MATSNLYYIKVLGIQPDFTTDDIAAYFQTARCGSGLVQEVIYLDAKKSAILIGIEGLNSGARDKLFKGVHKIKGKIVSVRYAKPPTDKQKAQAVLTSTGEEAASTLTAQRHVSAKKVAAQQEPLEQHMKPTSSMLSPSSVIINSEHLASNSSFTTAAIQSQPALQQSSGQVPTWPTNPHVDITAEHTQGVPSLPEMAGATGNVDPAIFANMNIFEAAKLPPPEQPVALQEVDHYRKLSAAVSHPAVPVTQDIMQQQDSKAAVQHGGHAGPLYAEYAGRQQSAITQQNSVHPALPDSTHPGPFPSGHTGLGRSTCTRPQHSSFHGPLHSGSFGVQHGAPKGQQHLGIVQSDDQEGSIGKSSHTPMGYSPVKAGGGSQPMPHAGTGHGEVSESIPPQEWPSFSPESEQPLPTTTQPVSQASSMSDQNSAMVQVEGVKGLNSKHLSVAFDNEEQGGGEIDDIVLNGDIALITFKDVKVATQVVSKAIWQVMGRAVPVSLYQPKPDPLQNILARHTSENTLVLKELPASVTDDYLVLHIEMVTGLSDDTDYKLDRQGDTALIQLNRNMAQDVWQKLSYSKRPLDKATKAMLKVEFLASASAVLMKSIEDDCCNEEFLKMYFRNKKKSGAGVNVTVEITGRGEALVNFEDLSVIPGVLSHNHTKELGQEVSMKLYHPILSHWFSAEGTGDKRPQRAVSVQHKCFTVPVSTSVGKHLNRVDLITPLNAQMADTCGKATLCEKGILVEAIIGSEWIKQWSTQCRDIVNRFISGITELSLDVPPGVMGKVYSVILAQVHNPNVTISPSDTEDQVVLVGSTMDVEELGTKVKKIIYENLDTVKQETLPVPVLVLIDHCVKQRLKGKHKNVLFKVDLQKQVLEVSGKDVGCDQFLEEVRALHPQVIDVRLEEQAVGLLASGNGKPLLLSKIGEQPVSYYFTTDEGKLPDTDMTTVSKLHLISENRKMAIKVAQSLQSTITVVRVDVPEEFHKHTIRSEAWRTARRRIENEFIARLCPEADSKRISIVCDSMHAEQIKLDLELFVQGECYKDRAIELERLQWEYLDTYSKDWRDLLAKIKDSGLTHSIPGETGPAVIKMKGEATTVSTFTRCIHEIRDSIKVQKKEVSKPGAVKHFRSTGGRSALKGIAAEQKAVVEVYTTEEEREAANRATGSLHCKICNGITDDGRMVNIMQGDLTEYSVDVMVNAANEELNHSGGIAGIISRKGGSIVQEESTKYVRRAGKLSIGDAVLLKPVGNLPCKAIVHAVGPRWNGGKVQEEAYLAKAVRNSLVEASKHNYTSVVFPAISSGIFGVPIDVCAKAMMQGIKDFSAQGHPPHLHSITIMLFQKEHIMPFAKASSVALKSFSKPTGPHLAQQPHPSTQKRSSATGSRRPSRLGVPVAQALELKKGSLTSYPADVYVNTAHQRLDLRHGAVAQSLLKAGGSVLQDECNRVVATQGTIPYWDIATTSGGNLQCQHIIHTVGQQYKDGSSGKNLERMIHKVMQECDRLKATSVAFPALGTGNLGFPEDVVAEVMVRKISSYLQQKPGTTVKKVLLVIFMDSTHKAFQQAMSSQVPSAPPPVEDDFVVLSEEVGAGSPQPSEVFSGPSEVLHSFSCNRVNVDIVNGDISADDSEGIVNTASDTLQLHNFGVMGALRRRGGQQLQDECNKAVAMHGKLEQYKVIVTGVGNHGADGLRCLKVLHVLAPSYSGGLAKTVSEALKCADKEGLRSVALPAIGTGEHGFSPAEAAEGIADGIVQFSKSVHDSVASIKVVLFQRDQFGNFARAFEEAGKKKGFLRRLLDKVASGTRNAVQSFLDIPPTLHSTPLVSNLQQFPTQGILYCVSKCMLETHLPLTEYFKQWRRSLQKQYKKNTREMRGSTSCQ